MAVEVQPTVEGLGGQTYLACAFDRCRAPFDRFLPVRVVRLSDGLFYCEPCARVVGTGRGMVEVYDAAAKADMARRLMAFYDESGVP